MNKYTAFWLLSCVFSLAFVTPISAQPTNLTPDTALQLGTEAYIYGYPLVTMEMSRRVMTNVATSSERRAPMGQFANMRSYPDPSFKDITTPNADTLYSIAWLDLSKEPYILQIPNENGRYFLMPILSGWTNVIADLGTRVGTKAENFAIVGPNWQGDLPQGVEKIESPTNLAWILGRTYSTGTIEDYKLVHAIQDQYTLTPLSAYGKKYVPPKGVVDPSIDMKTPVRKQVNSMDAAHYFELFAQLMKQNPPTTEDAPMVQKLAQLGIVLGKDFDFHNLDPAIAKSLDQAVQAGQQQILAYKKQAGVTKNGWSVFKETGAYDAHYVNRAFITMMGLGANLPQDAIYPEARTDSDGNTLTGANKYIIHFDKGQLPPVKGFWSLTLYNDQYYFVPNALHRYTLSQRNELKYNADGSVDLYIQLDTPGKDKEANWLPAPESEFVLMLRFYWPEEAIINGTWSPPPVKKIK